MSDAEFMCGCFTESVKAWRDEDGDVELSMWVRTTHRPTFRNRLRWVWRIVRTGKPYTDQVILHADEALKLAAWLDPRIHGYEKALKDIAALQFRSGVMSTATHSCNVANCSYCKAAAGLRGVTS